jgi:hypothetical protein
MGLFGKLVKTAVNVVTLPLDITQDVVTLCNSATDGKSSTLKKLEKIKEEADD